MTAPQSVELEGYTIRRQKTTVKDVIAEYLAEAESDGLRASSTLRADFAALTRHFGGGRAGHAIHATYGRLRSPKINAFNLVYSATLR